MNHEDDHDKTDEYPAIEFVEKLPPPSPSREPVTIPETPESKKSSAPPPPKEPTP